MDNWHRVSVDHSKVFYNKEWPTSQLLPEVYWQLTEMAGPGRETEWFNHCNHADADGLSWIWKTEGAVISDVCVYAFYFKDKDKAAWFKLTYG